MVKDGEKFHQMQPNTAAVRRWRMHASPHARRRWQWHAASRGPASGDSFRACCVRNWQVQRGWADGIACGGRQAGRQNRTRFEYFYAAITSRLWSVDDDSASCLFSFLSWQHWSFGRRLTLHWPLTGGRALGVQLQIKSGGNESKGKA